jgi:CBS domain-containing protein
MTHKNLVTGPVGTTLEQAKQILMAHKIEKLPIVDEDGMLKGLITIDFGYETWHYNFFASIVFAGF